MVCKGISSLVPNSFFPKYLPHNHISVPYLLQSFGLQFCFNQEVEWNFEQYHGCDVTFFVDYLYHYLVYPILHLYSYGYHCNIKIFWRWLECNFQYLCCKNCRFIKLKIGSGIDCLFIYFQVACLWFLVYRFHNQSIILRDYLELLC